jgi:hypothetical protein
MKTDLHQLSKEWPGRWTVCIFSRYETYGGPEEGGWTYSHKRFKSVIGTFKTRGDAKMFYDVKFKSEDLRRDNEERARRVNDGIISRCGGDETVNSNYPEGYIPRGLKMEDEDILEICMEGLEKTYNFVYPDPSEGYC